MQAALDTATDGIMIETAGRVVYANDAYAELLGYRRPAELLSHTIDDFIADSDAERLLRFSRLRAAGKRVPSSYDFAARRNDTSSIRLQASVSTALCAGATYITTIVRPFSAAPSASPRAPVAGPHDGLSAREREVLDMILGGKRAKVIALELELTEATVATHRMRLLKKIGVTDSRELYQYALRHGLTDWS